jgi:hypothetical protein
VAKQREARQTLASAGDVNRHRHIVNGTARFGRAFLQYLRGRPILSDLTLLESAILRAMCARHPEADALEAQIIIARVESRNNTGAGFYSRLCVDERTKKVHTKFITNVFAKIDGLKNPMAFVLFMRFGLIDTLEGAAVEESTIGVDFLNVDFGVITAKSRLN